MKITIPKGWHLVKHGTPVYYHDLQWDSKNKKWIPVIDFGDYHKKCKLNNVIREDKVRGDLMMLMRNFPHSPLSYYKYNQYNRNLLIAHILFLAGAESIKLSTGFSAGEKSIDHIQLHTNSIIVKPYITLPQTNGVNLLWFLLRKAGISYSGAAGEEKVSYMQACWGISTIRPIDIYCIFNAIKSEFKN